jgi:hypothetical protein
VDVDGDGINDNGNDTDSDGINDVSDDNFQRLVFTYIDGKLYADDQNIYEAMTFNPNLITYVTFKMPGERSVILNVPMRGFFTDDTGNIIFVSKVLDETNHMSIMISMTKDGFGRAFMGNDEEGFEMTGDLKGLKEHEKLTFTTFRIDGKLAGKTTIRPKDKNLYFDKSIIN